MSDITSWSGVAANNNASPPDGWPEGMDRAAVNDTARETHAAVRRHAEDGGWFDWGHAITYVGPTQFQPSTGDQTAVYQVGRRVRAIGTATTTITGTIAASVFSGNTLVTVLWDSGSLVSESLAVSVGPAVDATRFSPLPGMPAVELLEVQVAPTVPRFEFTTASHFADYGELRLAISGFNVAVNGSSMWLRLSIDGGSTWISTASYSDARVAAFLDGTLQVGGAVAAQSEPANLLATDSWASVDIALTAFNSAARPPRIMSRAAFVATLSRPVNFTSFCSVANLGAPVNGIQITDAGGSIVIGEARLYGLRTA